MVAHSCWICGQPSDTSEHRIKKSDLVQQYGTGPYRGTETLMHFKAGRVSKVQGPDSALVKYRKDLCGQCNSAFTKPFDLAYEQFIAWTMTNDEEVLRHRVIDFEPVFGHEWENKQRDLFKFFAKCFGCRLTEAGQPVPADVVDLLSKTGFTTALYVTFLVNEDVRELDIQNVGTEALVVHRERSTGDDLGFQCGHSVGWLTMMYWYRHFPMEPIGSRWIANSKHVYLGWRRMFGSSASGNIDPASPSASPHGRRSRG
jgi:hypothetical protein